MLEWVRASCVVVLTVYNVRNLIRSRQTISMLRAAQAEEPIHRVNYLSAYLRFWGSVCLDVVVAVSLMWGPTDTPPWAINTAQGASTALILLLIAIGMNISRAQRMQGVRA